MIADECSTRNHPSAVTLWLVNVGIYRENSQCQCQYVRDVARNATSECSTCGIILKVPLHVIRQLQFEGSFESVHADIMIINRCAYDLG